VKYENLTGRYGGEVTPHKVIIDILPVERKGETEVVHILLLMSTEWKRDGGKVE